ncbi:TetR/AcrR family transcriptional regulator [Massilia cavernae]|uniref:TetR/AcrR family transcriptional regulator n=1 Tax=Massilia cavernae TaxID=2320864 RepID=A0A418XH83_9BURK|nr:TetR/AcrR family transcriptional regulator [Massilia cavernae]RJG11801.1 TetR/AcrR family transcriptional regulator [Massilia cavernae]
MKDARLTYHHGNLRQELVDSAVELLHSEGEEALTLRAVARAAGVSQTAPYRHFSDRGALLAAVAETGFSKLDERCEHALSISGGPRDRLHRLGKAYVQFARDEPALYRLMFGAELGPFKDAYPSLDAGAKRVHDMMRITVEDLMPEGGAPNADAESACIAAWSLVHGLASLLIDRNINVPANRATALIDSVTSLFAKGLP